MGVAFAKTFKIVVGLQTWDVNHETCTLVGVPTSRVVLTETSGN